MSKNKTPPLFFSFSGDYLIMRLRTQDLKSDKTISTYRQGLNSFRKFMSSQYRLGISQISFDKITADIIREYLKYLTDAGIAPATRNHRLTTIKQYLLYCAERNAEYMQLYLSVSRIKNLRIRPQKRIWLSREAIQLILEQPPKTKIGIRDRFLMLFLYSTGARISEALNVRLKDIEKLTKEPFVRLIGKGNKPRCVPLLDITHENLKYYLNLYHPSNNLDDFLFYTIIKGHRDKMSVANAERLIKKYGHEARFHCTAVPETVHPHLFRHSFGAHMYRMGFALPVIAKLLDHESLNTTERYAETDNEMINQAFQKMDEAETALSGQPPPAKNWKQLDDEALAKLYGLT